MGNDGVNKQYRKIINSKITNKMLGNVWNILYLYVGGQELNEKVKIVKSKI